MENHKIQNLLSSVFSDQQLKHIPSKLLEKSVCLSEVKNINQFIEKCNADSINFKIAGEHRLKDWEIGWSGKGVVDRDEEYSNMPYYFLNSTHIRIKDRVFEDKSGFVEVDILRALQTVVFSEINFTNPRIAVIEYGCGTGCNIQFLKKRFSEIQFYAADWAQSAMQRIIDNKILHPKNCYLVDYFKKETFASPDQDFIAFTNASLEQTGSRYSEFIDYLVNNPFCLGGIHIEPIRDLLDLTSPLNKQSHNYAEKRGYLTGFLSYIKNLPVKVIQAKDYGIGSRFISGYQVLIWKKYD